MTAGGLLNDTLADAGYQAWLLFSAVALVLVVDTARHAIISGYNNVLKRSTVPSERWRIHISLYSFMLMVMIVVVVAALGIVLSARWVEQITSALVVGIGFGLQGPILDVVWGFIRRTYGAVMDDSTVIEVLLQPGTKPVRGRITHMYMTSFTLCGENGNVYIVRWSRLDTFKIITNTAPSLQIETCALKSQ